MEICTQPGAPCSVSVFVEVSSAVPTEAEADTPLLLHRLRDALLRVGTVNAHCGDPPTTATEADTVPFQLFLCAAGGVAGSNCCEDLDTEEWAENTWGQRWLVHCEGDEEGAAGGLQKRQQQQSVEEETVEETRMLVTQEEETVEAHKWMAPLYSCVSPVCLSLYCCWHCRSVSSPNT